MISPRSGGIRSGHRTHLCADAITGAPGDASPARLPVRLRLVSLGAGLAAAGFSHAEVRERPSWRAAERAMWEAATALDPGDDPALRAFHDEGVRSLDTFPLLRRVMATATAP
jgi:hypothetical protein